jgi:hypothetical protein
MIFGKPEVVEKIVYQTVPVPDVEYVEPTAEVKEAIAALGFNPGFKCLLARMRYVKAHLNRQLIEGKHSDMRDVSYLQSGIYWAGWLESELLKSQPTKPPAQASEFVEEAFEASRAALDVVGI